MPVPVDQTSRARGAARGRDAETPQDIPARGWKDVLRRAWSDTGEKIFPWSPEV